MWSRPWTRECTSPLTWSLESRLPRPPAEHFFAHLEPGSVALHKSTWRWTKTNGWSAMNLKASKLNRLALTEGVEWQLTVASFGHLSVIKRNIKLEGVISTVFTFDWAQHENTILRFPCLACMSCTAYSQDIFSPMKINCGKTCSDKMYKNKGLLIKHPTNHPLTTSFNFMEEFTRRVNNAGIQMQCFVGLFFGFSAGVYVYGLC